MMIAAVLFSARTITHTHSLTHSLHWRLFNFHCYAVCKGKIPCEINGVYTILCDDEQKVKWKCVPLFYAHCTCIKWIILELVDNVLRALPLLLLLLLCVRMCFCCSNWISVGVCMSTSHFKLKYQHNCMRVCMRCTPSLCICLSLSLRRVNNASYVLIPC